MLKRNALKHFFLLKKNPKNSENSELIYAPQFGYLMELAKMYMQFAKF